MKKTGTRKPVNRIISDTSGLQRWLLIIPIFCVSFLLFSGSIGSASVSSPDESCGDLTFTGLCFNPYLNGKNPNNLDIISTDESESLLHIIKPHTTWIRTFGTENGLEKIGKIAHSMGLKVMMGAWIDSNKTVNENQLKNLITASKAGEVDLAAIGNEALLRGTVTDDDLVSYIKRFKQEVPNVPVTCVDIYGEMIDHPKVVEAVDVVAVNIYAFWEGVSIDDALEATKDRYEKVKKAAPGKRIIISEMGWPSEGSPNGQAVPSKENAYRFMKESTEWAEQEGIEYEYFEAYDESWKRESDIGPHWGVWNENGQIKYDCSSCTTPVITLQDVPAKGTGTIVRGSVDCVNPDDYRILVFVQVDGKWYGSKPNWDNPYTTITAGKTWETVFVTGGNDINADIIKAYMVSRSYQPPKVDGATELPEELNKFPQAMRKR